MRYGFALLALAQGHCTASIVDRRGAASGATIVSTSADGSPLDFRLVRVPAKDHAAGARRNVFLQKQDFPRYSTPGRAPAYEPAPDQPEIKPIGSIPEVAHTHAYWDAAYGVVNEKGLAMGESSCAGKLTAAPISQGGHALFWVGELSDIAMERCGTARCAIQTMGDLATEYGFYGTLAVREAGEAMVVGDRDEAWVFHILPDHTGRSAVWAAARLPPGHAAVVPNVFVIHTIDLENKDDFMYSANMVDVARELGWYTDGPFAFNAIYSPGEYIHPHYAGRRVWRALSLLAPSLNLDPAVGINVTNPGYGWSVPVDTPVSLADMKAIYRDTLGGTPFDLRAPSVAGGPYSSPDRSEPGAREMTAPYGAWERPISMQRTMYAYTVELDASPVLHFCPKAPHASVYFPVPIDYPEDAPLLVAGNNNVFDSQSAWWITHVLSDWLDAKYALGIDQVRALQRTVEAFPLLVASHEVMAEKVWGMYYHLLAKFQTGYGDFGKTKIGYPEWVLEADKFDDWAYRYPTIDPHLPERYDRLRADFVAAQATADSIRHGHKQSLELV